MSYVPQVLNLWLILWCGFWGWVCYNKGDYVPLGFNLVIIVFSIGVFLWGRSLRRRRRKMGWL